MAEARVPSEPKGRRPYISHAEYGVPKTLTGMLAWDHVVERLESSKNYWIGTAREDGQPHTMPTWGVWVGDCLYFGGGPRTRWSRNLAANPQVAVHLESADDVVILEGTVGRIRDADDPRLQDADDAYEAKYQMRHGAPMWMLRPKVVFAWSQFPSDMSCWELDEA